MSGYTTLTCSGHLSLLPAGIAVQTKQAEFSLLFPLRQASQLQGNVFTDSQREGGVEKQGVWCLLVHEEQLLCKAEQQLLVIVGFFIFPSPLSSLQLHNYIGLAWCEFCRNFMWGLRNQGYRCKGKQTLSFLLISPNTPSLRVSLSLSLSQIVGTIFTSSVAGRRVWTASHLDCWSRESTVWN